MSVSSLFVVRAPGAAEGSLPAGGVAAEVLRKTRRQAAASEGAALGAFITPQSFISFPVPSGVVTLAWMVMRPLFPWGASTAVPAVTALLVGGTIFYYNVSEDRPSNPARWTLAALVGLANTLTLLAAALGIRPRQ